MIKRKCFGTDEYKEAVKNICSACVWVEECKKAEPKIRVKNKNRVKNYGGRFKKYKQQLIKNWKELDKK